VGTGIGPGGSPCPDARVAIPAAATAAPNHIQNFLISFLPCALLYTAKFAQVPKFYQKLQENTRPIAGSFPPYQPTPATCVLETIPIVSHFAQTPPAPNVIHISASFDPSLAHTHSHPYSRARRTAPGEFRHAHNPRSIRPRALLIGPK
jgi:hypothetical protein